MSRIVTQSRREVCAASTFPRAIGDADARRMSWMAEPSGGARGTRGPRRRQPVLQSPVPRLAESLEILAEILRPEAFDLGHKGRAWKKRPGPFCEKLEKDLLPFPTQLNAAG